MYEIHCPDCGEFRWPKPIKEPSRLSTRKKTEGCPKCGNVQAFSFEEKAGFNRADYAEKVRQESRRWE